MLNYGLRIINTQDPEIQKACRDKDFKGRSVIRLLSEVWDTENPRLPKLKEFLFDFKDLLKDLKASQILCGVKCIFPYYFKESAYFYRFF